MDHALLLTAVVAVIVVLFFLVQGLASISDSSSAKAFFLLGHKLDANLAASSHAAATMSLATVFVFFLAFGRQFGIALLIAPISIVAGAFAFNAVILPRLATQGFFESPRLTLSQYIYKRTGSGPLAGAVLVANVLGMTSVVLLELFIGVRVFAIFFAENSAVTGARAEDAALIILGVTVFVYTAFGGLGAVVRTDESQFKLMLAAVVGLLAWIVYASVHGLGTPLTIRSLAPDLLPLRDGLLLPYPLLANMLVVNLLFTTCMLRTWLVVAAHPTHLEARIGIRHGARLTALIATVLMLAGVLVFRAPLSHVESTNINSLLKALAGVAPESDGSRLVGLLAAYGVLPLLFAGCVAAMLSTIDSALLPVLQASMTHPLRQSPDRRLATGEVPARTAVLLLGVFVLYFVVFRWLGFRLETWLFTLFGFAVATGPAIVLCVVLPSERLRRPAVPRLLAAGIVGGVGVIAGLAILGNRMQDPFIVMWGTPLGVGIGALLGLIATVMGRAPGAVLPEVRDAALDRA